MEDVLDLYEAAPDPKRPRLGFDERPCQLIGQIVAPLPMKPARVKREDNEYKRNGTAVVLLAYDLESGRRFVEVRKRRTKADYADFMYRLVKEHYANVKQIRLVQDNLNTHSYGSFYEHLEAETAHWLKNKIEFHFTPKHGSWLNMAELELSALSRQCLDRRIESKEALAQEARAWEQQRNERGVKLSWSFTTTVAREKLKRHYDNLKPKN
jgi:hypothetical protein